MSDTIECATKLLGMADACLTTNCSGCRRWTHAHVTLDWESGVWELDDEVCERCRAAVLGAPRPKERDE